MLDYARRLAWLIWFSLSFHMGTEVFEILYNKVQYYFAQRQSNKQKTGNVTG